MMMSADKGAIAGAENAAPANDKHLIELNLIGDGLWASTHITNQHHSKLA